MLRSPFRCLKITGLKIIRYVIRSSYDIITFVSRWSYDNLRINHKTVSVNLGPGYHHLHNCAVGNSWVFTSTNHKTLCEQYAFYNVTQLRVSTELLKGCSVTLHLKFGTTYPLQSDFPIPSQPLNAALSPTYVNRFRMSIPTVTACTSNLSFADIQHITNFCIIIIIIIIIIYIQTFAIWGVERK